MSLAIFDLDHTLLAGDSDYLWGKFLAREGVVDGAWYESENQRYYQAYKEGTLDIYEFLAFSLRPLATLAPDVLHTLQDRFMRETIAPLISQPALDLVEQHRRQQHTLMIITATNRFITTPIAKAFGIPILLATEPEIQNGRYTGHVTDVPCFQEGKVVRLERWLEQNNCDLRDSWFYSDSHNDLPLLRRVDHPVAVNPDDSLRQVAQSHGWPILSLHDASNR